MQCHDYTYTVEGRNFELIKRVRDHIVIHPEQHVQTTWVQTLWTFKEDDVYVACGTTACVAGWACIFDGKTIEDSNGKTILNPSLWSRQYEEIACESMRINTAVGDTIFCGDNTKSSVIIALQMLLDRCEDSTVIDFFANSFNDDDED